MTYRIGFAYYELQLCVQHVVARSWETDGDRNLATLGYLMPVLKRRVCVLRENAALAAERDFENALRDGERFRIGLHLERVDSRRWQTPWCSWTSSSAARADDTVLPC